MQSKNKIRISVCIPNFNRAQDLDDVLSDCMIQTSRPYEIIVQDDSFDTKEIKKIDRVIVRYKGVKFHRNKKNVGLASNVNRVVQRAKGDYVVIVNNDDRLSKYYIQEIQNAITKYPKYDVYTTNACAITDDGSVFGDYRLFETDKLIKPRVGIKSLWKNFFLNLISVSGATIYKRSYLQKNLFESKYGNESDLNNALKLLSRVNIMYVNLPIYYVRMNAANTWSKITHVRALSYSKLHGYIPRYSTMFKGTSLPHET
jgi:glycosyltransferase involved in cell wall biosynthesis